MLVIIHLTHYKVAISPTQIIIFKAGVGTPIVHGLVVTVVQETSATVALNPTLPVVQDKVATLVQVLVLVLVPASARIMVQNEATLVLNPTSGTTPTMALVKEGTLALVLIKAEVNGLEIT